MAPMIGPRRRVAATAPPSLSPGSEFTRRPPHPLVERQWANGGRTDTVHANCGKGRDSVVLRRGREPSPSPTAVRTTGDIRPGTETYPGWRPHSDHPERQPTGRTVITTAWPARWMPMMTSFAGAERALTYARGLLPSLPLRVHLRRHERKPPPCSRLPALRASGCRAQWRARLGPALTAVLLTPSRPR